MQTKQQHAQDVLERFEDARNHGNGGNWWYPVADRIAYDIKVHGNIPDAETLAGYLTEKQKEYYTLESLQDLLMEELQMQVEQLIRDIDEVHGLDAYQAGRMGGWLEVQYDADDLRTAIDDIENVDPEHEPEQINEAHRIAQELEKKEGEVSEMIQKTVEGYKEAEASGQWYRDISEMLKTDEEIREEYQEKANEYQKKAQA